MSFLWSFVEWSTWNENFLGFCPKALRDEVLWTFTWDPCDVKCLLDLCLKTSQRGTFCGLFPWAWWWWNFYIFMESYVCNYDVYTSFSHGGEDFGIYEFANFSRCLYQA